MFPPQVGVRHPIFTEVKFEDSLALVPTRVRVTSLHAFEKPH